MDFIAGVPALGIMLAIAGVALLLGLIALWLARRHSRRERAEHAHRTAAEHADRAAAEPTSAGGASADHAAADPTQPDGPGPGTEPEGTPRDGSRL